MTKLQQVKKTLKILVIIFSLLGFQALLIGALYRIQSWEMPSVGGVDLNLLGIGIILIGLALNLMVLQSNWRKTRPTKRLELDGDGLQSMELKDKLKKEEELLL